MNAPLFIIVLVVCLLLMHVSTTVVVFHKESFTRFLNELSNDYIVSELQK